MKQMKKEILYIEPVFKQMIWGGEKLGSEWNYAVPGEKTGECWGIAAHPNGDCVIHGGSYGGKTLSQLWTEHPELFGNVDSKVFPLLVKIIDARQDLSIQVHPDNEQAKKWENQNGKTEMWYVVDAGKDARITYGVKEDISKDELSEAIKNNTVENLLNTVPSKKGDVFFVEAGTIHAIGKDNLIAEIQQNSNVTYRLYDYDRRGKDGKPRELHIEKGVKASNTVKSAVRSIPDCSDGTRMIGSCEYFQVKELILSKNTYSLNCDERSYTVLLQTSGESVLSYGDKKINISAGEAVFLGAGFGKYNVEGSGIMLTVNNPPRYFIGIDLGGTNIAAAVVDEYGVIYGRAKKKTNAPRPYNEIFDDMAQCARDCAEASGIPFEDIEAVGIGCPGSIDQRTGVIEFSNNLANLTIFIIIRKTIQVLLASVMVYGKFV